MASNDYPLNAAAIDELRQVIGGDDAVLGDLIRTFLEDAPGLLAQLQDAIVEGDAEKTRLYAHSLKGNGAEFGAASFSELCRQLEMLGKSGNLVGAPMLLEQIGQEYERVEAALMALLQSL